MRIALAVLFSATLAFARASAATTPPTSIATSSAPIVNVALSYGHVVVKTWTNDRVLVSAGSSVTWRYLAANQTAGGIPKLLQINAQLISKGGKVGHLPAEVFQLPRLAGAHDVVRLVGSGNVTLTVPAGSPILVLRVKRGSIALRGYRGTFFANVGSGGVRLSHVAGVGFAQSLHGVVAALDSSFDRVRLRNGTGGAYFERCVARQIVATSAFGNIAFDDGSFRPGLARFESKYGNLALGVGSGGAMVSAHSTSGGVHTTFAPASATAADPPPHNDTITIGDGAARVTVGSLAGTIYLYDGSIAQHPTFARAFPALAKLIAPKVARAAKKLQ